MEERADPPAQKMKLPKDTYHRQLDSLKAKQLSAAAQGDVTASEKLAGRIQKLEAARSPRASSPHANRKRRPDVPYEDWVSMVE